MPGRELIVEGAREHNLKTVDVAFPLGCFVAVTGVSGSGKSSLVNDILYASLANKLNGAKLVPGRHKRVRGVEEVDKVVGVDQSAIGRTPRSNPATYTGVFDHIRRLFAETTEAKIRGYQPGRFSFNVKGGRCEACAGDGTIKIEMNFLPDVYVPASLPRRAVQPGDPRGALQGQDHRRGPRHADRGGGRVLRRGAGDLPALVTLVDVGLGYIRLGQPAPTLSGGEAQRVKLASELQKRSTGRTVYVLDEPTTGLHFEDVRKLLGVLGRLVDAGNTVIVIEHNLDVIKTADWVIDMGPEGGDGGGAVVAEGPPEEVAACRRATPAASCTGSSAPAPPGPPRGAGPAPRRRPPSRSARSTGSGAPPSAGRGRRSDPGADAERVPGRIEHHHQPVRAVRLVVGGGGAEPQISSASATSRSSTHQSRWACSGTSGDGQVGGRWSSRAGKITVTPPISTEALSSSRR